MGGVIIEALCGKCGEIFNPHSDDAFFKDNEGTEFARHFVRSEGEHEGEECGGVGIVMGEWRSAVHLDNGELERLGFNDGKHGIFVLGEEGVIDG
jgi:hypothetical protein